MELVSIENLPALNCYSAIEDVFDVEMITDSEVDHQYNINLFSKKRSLFSEGTNIVNTCLKCQNSRGKMYWLCKGISYTQRGIAIAEE